MEALGAFLGIRAQWRIPRRGKEGSGLESSDMGSSNSKELTLPFSRPVKVLVKLYPENTVLSPRRYLICVFVRFC